MRCFWRSRSAASFLKKLLRGFYSECPFRSPPGFVVILFENTKPFLIQILSSFDDSADLSIRHSDHVTWLERHLIWALHDRHLWGPRASDLGLWSFWTDSIAKLRSRMMRPRLMRRKITLGSNWGQSGRRRVLFEVLIWRFVMFFSYSLL